MPGSSLQPSTINEALIMQRLTNIEKSQDETNCTLKAISESLNVIENRRIEHETEDKARHREHEAKITVHDVQLKRIEDRLDKYDKIIEKLSFTNTILAWLAGIIGSSVILGIIALVTGQATILFK